MLLAEANNIYIFQAHMLLHPSVSMELVLSSGSVFENAQIVQLLVPFWPGRVDNYEGHNLNFN